MRYSGFFAVLIALCACHAGPNFGPTDSAMESASSFSAIQSTILIPKCGTCHSAENPNGVNVFSYADVAVLSGQVTPYQPHVSPLFTQVSAGKMPPSPDRLSSTELRAIYTWIALGARND